MITNGMSADTLDHLMGTPIERDSPSAWNGSSLHFYSRAKDEKKDYERVMVITDSNGVVIFHEICLTD